MPAMRIPAALLAALLFSASAAGSADKTRLRIMLDENTKEIEGWFSAKGEWKILPMRRLEDYYPYDLEEDDKCVSIVNGTAAARLLFEEFDGKLVSVEGFAVKYDDLRIGDSPIDKLWSQRYYEEEPVFNSCMRNFVFVATDIQKTGRSE